MKPETKEKTKLHARRFGGWWILLVFPLLAVLVTAPQQGPVILYKLSQLSLGVLLAYAADRMLFRNAPDIDPEMPRDAVSAARLIGRAVVALGIIVGITLGI